MSGHVQGDGHQRQAKPVDWRRENSSAQGGPQLILSDSPLVGPIGSYVSFCLGHGPHIEDDVVGKEAVGRRLHDDSGGW
jgi:hypothetical protein